MRRFLRRPLRVLVLSMLLLAAVISVGAGSSPSRPSSTGVFPAAAVDTSQPPPGVTYTTQTLVSGGLHRSWLLATPKYEKPGERLPLLIDLHGRTNTTTFAATQSELLPFVGADDAVAVFPAGYGESWNTAGCCGAAGVKGINDLAFLAAMASTLAHRDDVDPTRTALLGFSNGGRMALEVGCVRDFAGTGLLLRGVVSEEAVVSNTCTAGPGVPTFITAGTNDPNVGFNKPTSNPDGGTLPSVQGEVAGWASDEGCATGNTTAGALPTYSLNCPPGEIEMVTVPGGTHEWYPSVQPRLDEFLRLTVGLPVLLTSY